MDTTLLSKRDQLLQKFHTIRQRTEQLCWPLETEDYIPQPIMDVSPPRWHLAHTTWFFETFLLEKFNKDYQPVHPVYSYLFNSYYQNAGDQWPREKRGNLSRPTVKEIYAYRQTINERMNDLLIQLDDKAWPDASHLVETGINHEQQHQELLLYDAKHILCHNPIRPTYNQLRNEIPQDVPLPRDYHDFVNIEGGVYDIGYQGKGFCYDNERPVQKVFLHDFALGKGLVTNEEYLEFMEDGGYQDFNHWLDDGWSWLQEQRLTQPLYWERKDGKWYEMTLNGEQPLNLDAPVTHISFYEAEAYASWAGMRLPTEFEWEIAALKAQPEREKSNLQNTNIFHPVPPANHDLQIYQMYGDVWEWTHSSYLPYHNYKPAPGAIGEYNGKFMANQMVLRGGSCATPANHIRKTYRNFFHLDKRWIFSGIRLAQ